ncbi:S1C family serine protease [Arthrobacter subterraneus]|uniref:S1C family serine protease n=1 Tax=Arthrobacter subterraneus TaxID=335973 RepID=UPI003824E40A
MTENNPGSYNGPLPPRPQNPPAPPGTTTPPADSGQPVTDQHPGQPFTSPLQHSGYAADDHQADRYTYDEANTSYGYGLPSHTEGSGEKQSGGKKRIGTGTFLAGMLIAGLVGGGVAAGTDALLESGNPASNNGAAQPQSVVVNDTESVNQITGAAAKASPSVVTISVNGGGSGGSGSGIILDAEGHILTNTHVVTLGGQVADPAVEVRTNDGRVFQAQVVGTDPLSDLAVIKIDAPDLQPATLADSSALNVGDVAIAIGAPLGLSGTVTDGIISTLNRTISVQSSAVPEEQSDAPEQDPGDGFNFLPPDGSQAPQPGGQGSIYLNVIQTDAAINQGNSGGALVDSQGRIIGVNVAIASAGTGESAGNIGVGFSIPINYAQRVAEEIIATGEASHGFLGVSVGAAASGNAEGSSSFSIGAQVQTVEAGSPAEGAGFQEGDIITRVGDLPIEDPQALTAAVRMLAEGESAQVELVRGGETLTLDVTVGQAPA